MVENARQDQGETLRGEAGSGPSVGPLENPKGSEFGRLEPTKLLAEMVSENPTRLEDPRRSKGLVHSISRVMLVLTIVGILGFIGGAAIATSILLGNIDLETAWVKDLMRYGKEAIKYLRP